MSRPPLPISRRLAVRAPVDLFLRASQPALRPFQRPLERWATASQQQARRNAMVAATALAQRRAEHADVEEYLAALRPAAAVVQPPHERAAQA